MKADSRTQEVFARLLELARQERASDRLITHPEVCGALREIGLPAVEAVAEVLLALQHGSDACLHVQLFLTAATEPELWRRIRGLELHSSVMDLSVFERVFAQFTRHFFRTAGTLDERAWNAAEALEAAQYAGLLQPCPIDDVAQLFALGARAKRLLHSPHNSFPEGPFKLPKGWRWLRHGGEVKELAVYSPDTPWLQIEQMQTEITDKEQFIVTDPAGRAWSLALLRRHDEI